MKLMMCVFKTRLQHAVHMATRENTNHRVFLKCNGKLTSLVMFEPGTGLQIHKSYSNVPYMKHQICFKCFYAFVGEELKRL